MNAQLLVMGHQKLSALVQLIVFMTMYCMLIIIINAENYPILILKDINLFHFQRILEQE